MIGPASHTLAFCLACLMPSSLAACSGSKTPDAETPPGPASEPTASETPGTTAADSAAPESAAAPSGDEPAAPAEAECKFRVKGFCFASEEEACNAADCPPGRCAIIEGKPSRVKCQ